MNMTRKHVGIAAAVAAALASGWGLAAAQQPEAARDLAISEVIQKLEALGYTSIHDVEKDDGVWEVDATSPKGERVELELDPKDGRILRERPDDGDDD
jgi:uncharacterized membrane protein YkoI